jgi:hypothetical protein
MAAEVAWQSHSVRSERLAGLGPDTRVVRCGVYSVGARTVASGRPAEGFSGEPALGSRRWVLRCGRAVGRRSAHREAGGRVRGVLQQLLGEADRPERLRGGLIACARAALGGAAWTCAVAAGAALGPEEVFELGLGVNGRLRRCRGGGAGAAEVIRR